MPETHKPREEVIKYLADCALHAMGEAPVPSLTPTELLSASLTLFRHLLVVIVANSTDASRPENAERIRTCLAELYQLVAPPHEVIH